MSSEGRQDLGDFLFRDEEKSEGAAQLGRDFIKFRRRNPELAVRDFQPHGSDPGMSENTGGSLSFRPSDN